MKKDNATQCSFAKMLKQYPYLGEPKDYREEMKRVNAPPGWWKPVSAEEARNIDWSKLITRLDSADKAYDLRMWRAIGFPLSLDYEYADEEGETYTLYDTTEMQQVIPAQTVVALIWNAYRRGDHTDEYDINLLRRTGKKWTVRAMQKYLETRGIKRSIGWIQKLFTQWKGENMDGAREKPKPHTELEHGPVVRYYHTKRLYDSATDSEVKRRLELQLEIAERKLETWKRQQSLCIGAKRVEYIITIAESKSCASKA